MLNRRQEIYIYSKQFSVHSLTLMYFCLTSRLMVPLAVPLSTEPSLFTTLNLFVSRGVKSRVFNAGV